MLHNMLHLQIAGSCQVVDDLLRVKLQCASVAGLEQITHNPSAIQHRQLEKNETETHKRLNVEERHNYDSFDSKWHLLTWSLGDGLRRNWSLKKGEQAASTTLCPLKVWLLLATMVMSQNCWRNLREFMCFRVLSPWPGNRKQSISIFPEEKWGFVTKRTRLKN